MNRYTNIEVWVRGIFGGAIGGAASSICMTVVDPSTFNFHEGWPKLWHLLCISSLVSVAMFLRQSPLPAVSVTTEVTSTLTTTETKTNEIQNPPVPPAGV